MNNLLSIALGVLAWGLPILYLTQRQRKGLYCITSLIACTGALYFQIRELTRLVNKPDISAVMDTINAVCLCATVLIIGTLLLNAIAAIIKERPKSID